MQHQLTIIITWGWMFRWTCVHNKISTWLMAWYSYSGIYTGVNISTWLMARYSYSGIYTVVNISTWLMAWYSYSGIYTVVNFPVKTLLSISTLCFDYSFWKNSFILIIILKTIPNKNQPSNINLCIAICYKNNNNFLWNTKHTTYQAIYCLKCSYDLSAIHVMMDMSIFDCGFEINEYINIHLEVLFSCVLLDRLN